MSAKTKKVCIGGQSYSLTKLSPSKLIITQERDGELIFMQPIQRKAERGKRYRIWQFCGYFSFGLRHLVANV